MLITPVTPVTINRVSISFGKKIPRKLIPSKIKPVVKYLSLKFIVLSSCYLFYCFWGEIDYLFFLRLSDRTRIE